MNIFPLHQIEVSGVLWKNYIFCGGKKIFQLRPHISQREPNLLCRPACLFLHIIRIHHLNSSDSRILRTAMEVAALTLDPSLSFSGRIFHRTVLSLLLGKVPTTLITYQWCPTSKILHIRISSRYQQFPQCVFISLYIKDTNNGLKYVSLNSQQTNNTHRRSVKEGRERRN